MTGEAFETRVESAKIWRTSVAHDFKYLWLQSPAFFKVTPSSLGVMTYYGLLNPKPFGAAGIWTWLTPVWCPEFAQAMVL